MATEVERLLVRLEVTQRKFERQLADAGRAADRRSRGMERSFEAANRNIQRSFRGMTSAATGSFNTIGRAAQVMLAGLGIRELAQFADAWTRVENQIRAAEQVSGTQARSMARLNDLSNETRSGLEETAGLYAKLLRISGDLGASEEQVAQATETVAKSFKAGGAAASEQAAAVLQLSQALASGELMGEELRSLRENAPMLAQAIADEFQTTIGGLKQLGSEGQLTADRVFNAILNGQEKIAKQFAVTTPTISDGFTIMLNGLRELVGAYDDANGASARAYSVMAGIGEWASRNTEAARRFGAQMAEAVKVMGEAAGGVREWVNANSSGFDSAAAKAGDYLRIVLDVFKTIISEASAVGALIASAMKGAVESVANGAVAIANGAIAAVEKILNGVITGINSVVSALNSISSVGGIPAIPTVGAVSIGRVQSPGPSGEDPMMEYRAARDGVRDALDSVEDKAVGIIERIRRAGDVPYGPPPPPKTGVDGSSPTGPRMVPGGAGDDEKGKKKKGKTIEPFFEDSNRQILDIKRDIEMIGLEAHQIEELRAKYVLLDEAKKRKLDLDKVSVSTGETLRQQIERQAAAIGDLSEQYERADERAQFFKDTNDQLKNDLLDAALAGESLSGVLGDLARSLAKAYFQASLFGDGPLGSGDGGFLGLGASLFGRRAAGGPVMAGRAYMTGENGPEPFIPAVNGRILSTQQAKQAISSPQQGSAGGQSVVMLQLSPDLVGKVLQEAKGQSVKISQQTMAGNARRANDAKYLREGK